MNKQEHDWSPYLTAQITDVRKGKGSRSCFTYAHIRDANGRILVSATLDYCQTALTERQALAKQFPSNNG